MLKTPSGDRRKLHEALVVMRECSIYFAVRTVTIRPRIVDRNSPHRIFALIKYTGAGRYLVSSPHHSSVTYDIDQLLDYLRTPIWYDYL